MFSQADRWNRRTFLRGVALGGAVLAGLPAKRASAEPPPETTRLRLVQRPVICFAPMYVAEPLLRGEGFTNVEYVKKERQVDAYQAIISGEVDVVLSFGPPMIARIDAGDPVVFLAGGHVGCLQLVGTDRIRTIRDLKGATVALADGSHLFLASMLSYVGLDHRRDVTLMIRPEAEATRLFIDGKIDAVMLSPPFPQQLAARKIGRVVLNTSVDRPWSEYFCCMVTANRAFVQKHPVATKRALRALLKSTD